MPQAKRILKIEIKRMDDPDPDTSWLGEYSNTRKSEFSIDRSEPDDSGDMRRGEYRYFNPGSVEPFNPDASWISRETRDKRAFWEKTMCENARLDYERMESFTHGDWHFIGIRAEAEIVIDSVIQRISSGGLWGTESDSDESYLKEIEQEELSGLRSILHEMGFSKRAIASAMKASEL